MSYLLDKKAKRNKLIKNISFVIFFLILFYFRSNIFSALSYGTHKIIRPILVLGGNIGVKFSNLGSFFTSKNSLYLENEKLKSDLAESNIMMANYASLLLENLSLKDILGRKDEKMETVLSAILSKPNKSLYDTLIIDVGEDNGLKVGSHVFALGRKSGEVFGSVPIGYISAVYPNSAKVVLFSSPGEKKEVVINGSNIFMELIGRGGGNFEMIIPRDINLLKGDQVLMPGINPYVLALVETILSDPRDPFTKALLVSPVNVQEIKFVEVKK